jgi:DUF4097 and DUF4098 domain-containing protein YvlB
MKNLSYFPVILLLLPLMSKAQRSVEQSFVLDNAQSVYLKLNYANNIVLKPTKGKEVQIKATVDINNNTNNDKFELKSSIENNQLTIKSVINDLEKVAVKAKARSKDEDDRHTYYGGHGYWDAENRIYVHTGKEIQIDVDYEILVPQGIKLKVKTISGNIKGNVTDQELTFESISGDIDAGIAENQRASVDIKTISGDVYTNLKLEIPQNEKNGLERVGGSSFKDKYTYQLNGGGNKIVLKTISGNIYLRKK